MIETRRADEIRENDRIMLSYGEVVTVIYVSRPSITLSCECCSDYDYDRVLLYTAAGSVDSISSATTSFDNDELVDVVVS